MWCTHEQKFGFLSHAEVHEQHLVARLRLRDESAFAHLVSLYRQPLIVVARRILRNEDDAHDAVQTAFASAFAAMDRFDERSKVETWLHRIVINAALMMLRSRRRRPEKALSASLSSDELDSLSRGTSSSRADDPEVIAIKKEEVALLRTALNSLKADQRRLIELRHFREMSTKQAGLHLSLTAGATKVRLHRARRALRAHYSGLMKKAV
jgi:RNA polymerase sigma-70 factor, ECF subfamily